MKPKANLFFYCLIFLTLLTDGCKYLGNSIKVPVPVSDLVSEHNLVSEVLMHIQLDYIDSEKLVPELLLQGALTELERMVPEVWVETQLHQIDSIPKMQVKVGNEILKSLNLRHRGVKIISCPSCARQAFQVIDIVKILEDKLSHIKKPLTLSIIGCVVNGPGEASQTDIGLTGGGEGNNLFYLSGIPHNKVANKDIIEKVVELVESKAKEKVN